MTDTQIHCPVCQKEHTVEDWSFDDAKCCSPDCFDKYCSMWYRAYVEYCKQNRYKMRRHD